jgi:Flp pilus assembly protein TadG
MIMHKRLRDQRGVASLEFVLILPILLFVLFASVELSRAWFTLNLLTTAAREAARAGVTATPDAVQSAATTRLTALLGPTGQPPMNWSATVACNPAPCAIGTDSRVQVDVTANFQTVLPTLLPMLGSITLQQTASMRYE